MLNKAIADKLNEQINLEFYSSNVYLQMSSWCSKHGYEGAAAFLLRHADEELEHMQKLFNSIIDKFNLVGEDGRSLYFIDRDLATL